MSAVDGQPVKAAGDVHLPAAMNSSDSSASAARPTRRPEGRESFSGGGGGVCRIDPRASLGKAMPVAAALLEAIPTRFGLVAHGGGGLAHPLARGRGTLAGEEIRGGGEAGAQSRARWRCHASPPLLPRRDLPSSSSRSSSAPRSACGRGGAAPPRARAPPGAIGPAALLEILHACARAPPRGGETLPQRPPGVAACLRGGEQPDADAEHGGQKAAPMRHPGWTCDHPCSCILQPPTPSRRVGSSTVAGRCPAREHFAL